MLAPPASDVRGGKTATETAPEIATETVNVTEPVTETSTETASETRQWHTGAHRGTTSGAAARHARTPGHGVAERAHGVRTETRRGGRRETAHAACMLRDGEGEEREEGEGMRRTHAARHMLPATHSDAL
eukprot:5981035-Prymnesium_polylepis.1